MTHINFFVFIQSEAHKPIIRRQVQAANDQFLLRLLFRLVLFVDRVEPSDASIYTNNYIYIPLKFNTHLQFYSLRKIILPPLYSQHLSYLYLQSSLQDIKIQTARTGFNEFFFQSCEFTSIDVMMSLDRKDRYQRMERIGEGTYGVVFKARDSIQKDTVAVKKIKLENQDEGVPSTAMREISILKQLQPHPNIVKLREVSYIPNDKKLHLIFDFHDYDMKKYMNQHKQIVTSYQVKLFLYQLINGVNYCHSRRIIHRDLKPQNLLIDKNGSLKIADFGLARAFGIPIKTLTHEIETLWYRAPEVLLGQKQYSLGVDIWAVGCIFAELIEKKPMFNGDSEIDQIFKIFQFHGTPSLSDWPNIQKLPDFKPSFPKFKGVNPDAYFKNFDKMGLDLCLRMLALDPARRISMKESLKHSYFNDLSPEDIAKYQI